LGYSIVGVFDYSASLHAPLRSGSVVRLFSFFNVRLFECQVV